MLPRLSGNIHQLVSFGALSLLVAVLVCLSVVFAGCTSTSSSSELYFMKVNLSEFPQLGNLHLRRSLDLSGIASSATDGATSVASDATESLDGVAAEVSTAADSAATKVSSAADAVVSQANDALATLEDKFRADLPAYYAIGLWGYCEGNDTRATSCSKPSVSFTFNLSGILDSVSTEINDVISDIDDSALTGYRDVSRAVTWLYIFGFVATTLTTLLAIRKVFFNGGNGLLIIFGTVSLILITAATVGVIVIYGLIAAGIKAILGPFGASASLGSHTLAAAWLAVAFSAAGLLVWIVESCCCVLNPL